MNPRIAIGLIVLWLLSLVWVYQFATRNAHNATEAAKVKPLERAIERHNETAVAVRVVERVAIRAEARQAAHTRTLLEESRAHAQTNPAPADCRLDDDGLRQWRAANHGAPADSLDVPDRVAAGEVTGPEERPSGRSEGQPHRNSRDVSPGEGALQGAGGLVEAVGSDSE